MKLGKKAKMEKGTFMAYACTCNCLCYCSSCSNCQTIANVQGKATTKSLNNNNTTNKTFGTLILMG